MYFSEATVATNKSEKTLKRYIKKGDLQWRRMGKQPNSPVQVWITADFIAEVGGEVESRIEDPDIFDEVSQDVDCSPEVETTSSATYAHESTVETSPYEHLIKTMVGEFTVQLDRQREVLFELRRELHEKDNQLRLLPDLQKQLEEKEKMAHVQTLALEKQIDALQSTLQDQGKLVDELQSDNEKRLKLAEELQEENDKRSKVEEELRQENEKLRAETEKLKAKGSWLKWFFGRPTE